MPAAQARKFASLKPPPLRKPPSPKAARARPKEPPAANPVGARPDPLAALLNARTAEPDAGDVALMLGDSRYADSANSIQKAEVFAGLQQRYGNSYAQEVGSHIQAQGKEVAEGPKEPRPAPELPPPEVAEPLEKGTAPNASEVPKEKKEEKEGTVPSMPAPLPGAEAPVSSESQTTAAPAAEGAVPSEKPLSAAEAEAGAAAAAESPGEIPAPLEAPLPAPAGAAPRSRREGGKGRAAGAEGTAASAPAAPAPQPAAGPAAGTSVEPSAAAPVEAAGSAEQRLIRMTESPASQIAASYDGLGEEVGRRLEEDALRTTQETPPVRAAAAGAPAPAPAPRRETPAAPAASLGEGVIEGEPPPVKAETQPEPVAKPDNSGRLRSLLPQSESGFLGWIRKSASKVLNSIATADPALSTDAGERPSLQTQGMADPQRAARQGEEGRGKVAMQGAAVAQHIAAHPGKGRIQPRRVEEQRPISLAASRQALSTEASEEMAFYASAPLPGAARKAADELMAPVLQDTLQQTRKEVETAAMKRDKEQAKAVEESRRQAAELSAQAEQSQNEAVERSRRQVAAKQKEGQEESSRLMQEFDQQSRQRQNSTIADVEERISRDEADVDAAYDEAERKSEEKKREGERQAEEKRKEAEEDGGLWGSFKSFVGSVVDSLSSAIDSVFDAVRQAVKGFIEAAKKAAVGIIEAGRRFVVGALQVFGDWLKGMVNTFLADRFPALASAINGAIDQTVNAAIEEVNRIADDLKAGVEALADALSSAIDSILGFFQGVIKGAIAVAGALLTGDFGAAAEMIFRGACRVLGIDADRIIGILKKAGDALMTIFLDPIGFLGNLLSAVNKGFGRFRDNFLKHLQAGLMSWLFGTLEGAGIQIPSDFSLKSIFGLVAQILGITYEKLRKKAVKLIGEKNVALIERVTSWISTLISEGVSGLWEEVKDYVGNLKDMIFEAVKDWVLTRIVQAAVIKLASMFNPVGAIIQAVLMIYDTIMFFIERINQIIALVESIVNSIYEIATGALETAANWVERAMANTLPVIISFLARLLRLGGVSKQVQKFVKKVRKKVDMAIDKVLAKIVNLSKKGKPEEKLEDDADTEDGYIYEKPVEGGHTLRVGKNLKVYRFSEKQEASEETAKNTLQEALESRVPFKEPDYPTESPGGRAKGPSGHVRALKDGKRASLPSVKALPGRGLGYMKGDHRGHLIADRFDGSPVGGNLVPMHPNLNLSDFKSYENKVAGALKKEKNNAVLLFLKVTPHYTDSSPSSYLSFRPTRISADSKLITLNRGASKLQPVEKPLPGTFSNPARSRSPKASAGCSEHG